MALGLLGKKRGMTQIFGKAGEVIPVTVLEAGPCTVVKRKRKQKEGYDALLLGFEKCEKTKRLSKAMKGFFAKQKSNPYVHLKEFRIHDLEGLEAGSELKVDAFQAGERVDVEGLTKGRGFQGVIKRHGKHGGPDAHGSDFHRRPGSIGMRTWPGRVLKNMRLPGRMGSRRVLTRGLQIVEVLPDKNLLLVRGAVPGSRGALIIVYHRGKDFEDRLKKRTTDQGPQTTDHGPRTTDQGLGTGEKQQEKENGDTKEDTKEAKGS